MTKRHPFFCFFILLLSCSSQESKSSSKQTFTQHRTNLIHVEGGTIEARFNCPPDFKRIEVQNLSFPSYLRSLPLRKSGAEVHYYSGEIKTNKQVYCAVVDMDLDAQDLQQCADAVMRLRGEYQFQQKSYEDIQFNFLSDGKPRRFTDYANGDFSYKKFRKYMKYIFSYANTASLHDELPSRPLLEMQIGDVFIQKRQLYGHAVIVVDMCVNHQGEKKFMLAQSYMPAQDTQILFNPHAPQNNPWYDLKEGEILTPEWSFISTDLRHFPD